MRINKFLTDKGFCSRREADRLIQGERVKIGERLAVLGDQVADGDVVSVDDKVVAAGGDVRQKVYLMYHKPRGVICTTDLRDPDNIIEAVNYPERVFPIGRLDKDSTGLIFLTSDGDIVNKILRAQYGHEKEYIVNVDKPFDDQFLVTMGSGVDIGDHITLPCKLERINRSTFNMVLTEGKNRQIRRMCESLGFRVRHLSRVRIMNVKLGTLEEGRYQWIPGPILADLKKLVDLKVEKPIYDNFEDD